jgi:hypothetical protein
MIFLLIYLDFLEITFNACSTAWTLRQFQNQWVHAVEHVMHVYEALISAGLLADSDAPTLQWGQGGGGGPAAVSLPRATAAWGGQVWLTFTVSFLTEEASI